MVKCLSFLFHVPAFPSPVHAAQKYSSSNLGVKLNMKIASGSSRTPGLKTYIKLFNKNEEVCQAFRIDD